MKSIDEAAKYMSEMGRAVRPHLIAPEGTWSGKDGHLRLARECGYALRDFDEPSQQYILQASYSTIYIVGCNLKPILDAKEWIAEMKKGMERK